MTQENQLPPNAVVINECRIAYPNLVTPAPDLNGQDKYSCVLLIPKTANVDDIKRAIIKAREMGVSKKWGGAVPPNLHIPIQDGDVYAKAAPDKRGHYVGNYYINAKQDPEWGKPTVVDAYGLESESPQTVMSGDFVAAVLEFYPYKGVAGSGISATPKLVKKLRDGEPIGGGVSKSAAMAALGLDPSATAGGGGGETKDPLDDLPL